MFYINFRELLDIGLSFYVHEWRIIRKESLRLSGRIKKIEHVGRSFPNVTYAGGMSAGAIKESPAFNTTRSDPHCSPILPFSM